jgi:hypothetical protein
MLVRGIMRNRYRIFRRRKFRYIEDVKTGKQESLHTKDRQEAERLRQAPNEALKSPMLSVALGRAYQAAYDCQSVGRIWSDVMNEMSSHGKPATRERCGKQDCHPQSEICWRHHSASHWRRVRASSRNAAGSSLRTNSINTQ